ncbi:hypothetical protein [Joostella sp. CR20]|uniref:hypothetical protein n=1 Tax=Joostella sp. CR20 TaxID=2804312 RepID=UPI00313F1BC8
MKKTYKSTYTYSILETLLLLFFSIGIGGVIISNTDSNIIIVGTAILVCIICIITVLYKRKNTFEIAFEEGEIVKNYTFIHKKVRINYKNLLAIEYIDFPKSSVMNKVKYKSKNRVKTISFVAFAHSDDYLEFIKWLKSKNENIELKVSPSDHIMNYKIQEIYGFKYRKFLKDTL